MKIKGLYVHIPFCVLKCNYCDFNSYTIPVRDGIVDKYLSAIQQELNFHAGNIYMDEIETIYIGGGTPTILSTRQLTNLMSILHSFVDFSKIKEAVIEANPGTIDGEKLKELK